MARGLVVPSPNRTLFNHLLFSIDVKIEEPYRFHLLFVCSAPHYL